MLFFLDVTLKVEEIKVFDVFTSGSYNLSILQSMSNN